LAFGQFHSRTVLSALLVANKAPGPNATQQTDLVWPMARPAACAQYVLKSRMATL
jgi:hypothetical protein